MTSEDDYSHKPRPALKALQLQTEENLPQFVPFDKNLTFRSHQGKTIVNDHEEYKAKGAIRRLGAMLAVSDNEI